MKSERSVLAALLVIAVFLFGSWPSNNLEVEGLAQNDGVILANRIEVEGNPDNPTLFVNFRGVIETLPNTTNFVSDWTVSGRTVKVTDQTRINQERGQVVGGAFVEISGALNNDGSVNAQKIEVRQAPGFAGLEQMNVEIPANVRGSNLTFTQ